MPKVKEAKGAADDAANEVGAMKNELKDLQRGTK